MQNYMLSHKLAIILDVSLDNFESDIDPRLFFGATENVYSKAIRERQDCRSLSTQDTPYAMTSCQICLCPGDSPELPQLFLSSSHFLLYNIPCKYSAHSDAQVTSKTIPRIQTICMARLCTFSCSVCSKLRRGQGESICKTRSALPEGGAEAHNRSWTTSQIS